MKMTQKQVYKQKKNFIMYNTLVLFCLFITVSQKLELKDIINHAKVIADK